MAALLCICALTPTPQLRPARPIGRPRLAAARCAEGEGADDDGSLLGGLLPKESNPYMTSKADRMRAAFGEGSVVGKSGRSGGRLAAEERLAEDIARFKAERGLDADVTEEVEGGLLQQVIDTLGNILTVNFFIICVFFTWFLTGVGAQYGAQNTAIIEAFRGAWDLIILPLLTTHMTLTFLSAGLERIAKSGQA